MPTLQHVTSVKAINQEEPPKNLDLRSTFGFPQPSKGCVGIYLAEEELIIVCGFKELCSPRANPNILALREGYGADLLLEGSEFFMSLNREG